MSKGLNFAKLPAVPSLLSEPAKQYSDLAALLYKESWSPDMAPWTFTALDCKSAFHKMYQNWHSRYTSTPIKS